MKSFEEIKSEWEHQNSPEAPKDGIKTILEKVSSIRKKQRIMNIILSLTILVLILFFIYITAYKNSLVAWSLILMIASLITRIGLELHSLKKLKRLNINKNANSFKQSMIYYYKNRVNVHIIWTPVLIVLYAIGFILLLPSFKQSLSKGFYNYIVISSIILLITIGFFIFKQIKKELSILKELKN